MEAILDWFNRVGESFALGGVFQAWVWIDWTGLVFVILGILYGLKKGLVREIIEFLEMLIIVYVVMQNYEKVTAMIQLYVPRISYEAAPAVAFTCSAIVVWLVVFVIDAYLKKIAHAQLLAPIRYMGGALVGFFHFLLIFSFLCQPLSMVPYWPLKRIFEAGNSYSAPRVIKIAKRANEFVSLPVEFFRKSLEP